MKTIEKKMGQKKWLQSSGLRAPDRINSFTVARNNVVSQRKGISSFVVEWQMDDEDELNTSYLKDKFY